MDENETIESIRDEGDKNEEDNSEFDGDKGSKKRSQVQDHFSEERKDDKPIATCKHCKKVLSGNTKGGTSHLKHHLENVCKKYQKNLVNQMFITVSSKDLVKAFKFNQEETRK